MIGHGGAIEGFVAQANWYQDERVAVVVLMNSTGPMSPAVFRFDVRNPDAPVLHVSGSAYHYVLRRQ
jgi:hypothetical protein